MNDELPRYCKALYLMGYFFYHTKINVFYLQQPPPYTKRHINYRNFMDMYVCEDTEQTSCL